MGQEILREKMNYGKFYEEFETGKTYRHQLGKTITESDNNLFSLLTMNHHPVHLDEHYAKNEQHGKILVVGTLIFSLSVGLTVSDCSGKAIANLGYDNISHSNPVFIGDTIYCKTTVLEKRLSSSKTDRGIVVFLTEAFNQDGAIVLTFRRTVLIKRKL